MKIQIKFILNNLHKTISFWYKNAKILTILFLILFFSFSHLMLALDPKKDIKQYVHDVWQSQYGLPQINTSAIMQTSDNYIWLTTQEGIMRFDGVRFTLFNSKNTDAIRSNVIRKIFEDSKKNLWIGTALGLVCLKNEHFKSYTTKEGLSNDIIDSIIEDRKGNLWIGTPNGLNLFKDGKFKKYSTKDGMTDDAIGSIYEDRKGNLWVTTQSGLNCIRDGKIETYTARNGLPSDSISSIHESKDGYLWIGTNGAGLTRFKDGQFLTYTIKDGLTSNDISSILEDREGAIWLPTYSGLNRIKDGKITSYSKKNGKMFYDIVTSLYEDRDGILWIGTGKGLYRFWDEEFMLFTSKDGLSNDIVMSIFEDREGSLWIGTSDGLNRMRDGVFTSYTRTDGVTGSMMVAILEDREGSIWITTYSGLNRLKNGNITAYTTEDGLSHNQPTSLCEDSEGNLWISTPNGLNRMRNAKFTIYTQKDGLSTDRVGVLCEDRSGNLWIGTGMGLNCYKDGNFTSYSTDDGLSDENVTVIYDDRLGNLWIGTNSGGLNRFHQGKFTVYTTQNGLSNNNVKALLKDKDGTLWIGTYHGLSRLKDGKFTSYTSKEGLFDDIIHHLLEDEQGNLWMSCNRGVFKVSKKALDDFAEKKLNFIECISYDKTDGMKSAECNGVAKPAGWKSKDGKLWFPTMNGIAVIDPNNIKTNREPPPIIIEKMIVDEEIVDLKGGLPRLAPGKKILEFQYTAPSFLAPEKVFFKYKLEGFEKKWQSVNTRRTAYYTSIPPGNYRFRVFACNNDGIWNNTGASFDFYLKPFFYQTWWFYTICALLILFSGFGIYRLRIRQLKKNKQELEILVGKRTIQLKNANQELEKLSIVASETDNAVAILDAQGNFEWINDGFTRIYGDTLEQLINERGKNLKDVSTNPQIKKLIQSCTQDHHTTSYESQIITRSGQTKWAQTTVTPVIDEDGEIFKIVIIESDVTKIKEAEERAEHANQSKSEFLARMSHEIRTPMNGVIGFTDMLIDTELTEEQLDFARTINRSGEALITLLNDILDFSKIEAGELSFEPIDFDPELTVFDICDLLLPRIGTKPVEILCRIGDKIPAFIKTDPGRFRQVIVNLMGNAAKFTEKGEIELSLDIEAEEDNRLKIHVSIRDTGIGIDPDKQENVFNVFQQADGSTTRKYGGTGLGLSICRQISRLMGGDVWVDSTPGKGSLFHFTCWVDRSDKIPSTGMATHLLEGKRALIVDDNPTNLEILTYTLELFKLNIIQETDPQSVISTIKQSFDNNLPIDICIIDIQMPKLSGFDLARQIRKEKSPIADLPLLAFSSSTLSRSSHFREAGFNGFLPKPIRRKKLIKMVERLLSSTDTMDERDNGEEIVTQHSIIEESKHSLNILLAEDNPINLKLARFILERAGYSFTIAQNGKEAVEIFLKQPELFDMILMDIQMPEIDGKAATQIIRKKGYKDIPIIAMTAEAMKGDREKCIEAGMNDYISKPIKRNIIFEMVKKYCLDK